MIELPVWLYVFCTTVLSLIFGFACGYHLRGRIDKENGSRAKPSEDAEER
jgi:hypothetical protein